MGNRTVTVKFVDFWQSFDWRDNRFVRALRSQRQVTVLEPLSPEVPDILFYSRGPGCDHLRYDCLKVYFTGENDFPDFNECDYALSFYECDCGGRNLRYPLYMLYECDEAACPPVLSDAEALDRGFCSLVMSNASNCHPRRLEIVDAIEAYRPLAYGGAFRNNVGSRVEDKISFISGYKFNLALENSVMPGYVTEKLLEPLAAATVPIYWGADAAKHDFNPESFVCVNDYATFDSLVAELRRLDNDSAAYLAMLRAPSHTGDTVARMDTRLAEFLNAIADHPERRISPYGEIHNLQRRNRALVPLWHSRVGRAAARLLGHIAK